MSNALFKHYGVGWNIDEVFRTRQVQQAHSSLQDLDLSEAIRCTAAFIQSWLYLGLLESICARPIPTSYMVGIGSDGSAYLCSRMLPVLLQTWTRSLLVVEAGSRDQTLRSARECALMAYHTLRDILAGLSQPGYEANFLAMKELLLPFDCALSALCEAITRLAEVDLLMDVRSFSAPPALLVEPYAQRLVRKGWCRFVIASVISGKSD